MLNQLVRIGSIGYSQYKYKKIIADSQITLYLFRLNSNLEFNEEERNAGCRFSLGALPNVLSVFLCIFLFFLLGVSYISSAVRSGLWLVRRHRPRWHAWQLQQPGAWVQAHAHYCCYSKTVYEVY